MAKKTNQPSDRARSAADYYKLHSQAVRDLAEANEENSPQVSREELNKYRSHRGLHLSDNAKAILVKYWFNAAVCFFFYWGLAYYVPNVLDNLVIMGIGMGVVTDLLTNNALRHLAATEGGNDRWMMFPNKGYASFPLNIVYAFLVLAIVVMLYNVLNLVLIRLTGGEEGVAVLGVEPLLFGLLYLLIDLAMISLRHLWLRIVSDAKKSTKERGPSK